MAGVTVEAALLESKYDAARKATYLALDVDQPARALELVESFAPVIDGFKVGLELFHRAGMAFVDQLLARNLRVFLDMKLHDIPNTVSGALRAICDSPIEMVNVHAQGGRKMLEKAREAVSASAYQPLLIGVTVLTSLSSRDIRELGVVGEPQDAVLRLAKLCQEADLDGVVCSAEELNMLQTVVPSTFERVVPGTRLATDDAHDQQRTQAPGQAMAAGATRLVLGRAVRDAADPMLALQRYWDEMIEGVDRRHGTASR